MTEEQQLDVTREVSHWIREAVPVGIAEESYDNAVSRGAMALFGEKYGDEVRTVEVPGFSLELCGGCHVGNTGEIGNFVIVSERGVASGVRRIEALCGELGESWQREREHLLRAAEKEAGVDAERLTAEIASLRERTKEAEKELQSLRMKMLSGETGGDNGGSEESIGGVKVLVQEVPPAPTNELRNLADVLRNRLGSGVVVLGDERRRATDADRGGDGRSDGAGERRSQLAKAMGAAAGGSGGGRKDFAQAGGKDPQLLSAAFDAARGAVNEQMWRRVDEDDSPFVLLPGARVASSLLFGLTGAESRLLPRSRSSATLVASWSSATTPRLARRGPAPWCARASRRPRCRGSSSATLSSRDSTSIWCAP